MVYNNPLCGMEESETYRKNYGLDLFKYGAEGALNYAYQIGDGVSWDDFGADIRIHIMAYPRIKKPVFANQWEGWWEGVDDVRYLTYLCENDTSITFS